MNRHHPSDDTLIAEAAGTLQPLHARVLGVHLSACPLCRDKVLEFEEIGGCLLTALPTATLRPDALAQALAQLDTLTFEPAAPPASAPSVATLATGRWWWLGRGVRLMPLVRRDQTGTRLDLIRAVPGMALPGHAHSGPEMVCVLQGSFVDQTGHYAVHDIAESDADLRHTPIAAPGPDCICLIATTGRVRANTWLTQLIQPLIDF